ncbi:vWA domain-containing protein [Calycomorphotria hydatis]|uniref:VWFA domain-containing protein n=1 Tax=Calycomorphotria hydatis TaxID=2528027 RepID=A0A517T4F7_9PLAN|nr:vWA domain-containing protein [Calycomorphotria hydatis]QDT63244.1 hypothetical protein V22_04630 [Calycomorphotria hydatis]
MNIARINLTAAVIISLILHFVLLFVMGLIRYTIFEAQPELLIETIFDTERVQEEFNQELTLDTSVSENLTTISGGVVSTAVGSPSETVMRKDRIETSEQVIDPLQVASINEFTIPSESVLGSDLGEKAVAGETGAVVEGYGAALSRISKELIRLMREQDVMVVWLFDESESMKDDQKEIRDQFLKIYEELGIAAKKDEKEKAAKKITEEPILTVILSFGAEGHELTPKPTADIEKIREAIDKIQVDESGKEMTYTAIQNAVQKYRPMAFRQQRRLAVVLVSDESGDDGEYVEEALLQLQRANAPLYVMGRQAIFGYPYARIRWQDPMYGLWHWLNIRRGPETARAESLAWDGFTGRHDSRSSGFGPYEQARLAKESGGIFFLLPGEQEALSGSAAKEKRVYDFLDMKEYQPQLLARREYDAGVERSPKFRKMIQAVIARLNPNLDKAISIRRWVYPMDIAKFREEAAKNFPKALRNMQMANEAIALMDRARPERDLESSRRWRAQFDLIDAQLRMYRFRLFQYLLAVDQHVKNNPQPKNKKSNTWDFSYRKQIIEPDEEQIKRTKIDMEELNKQKKLAEEKLREVIREHPNTPWARTAQAELNAGFGIRFYEVFRDPNYERPDIKIPKF